MQMSDRAARKLRRVQVLLLAYEEGCKQDEIQAQRQVSNGKTLPMYGSKHAALLQPGCRDAVNDKNTP